MRVFNCQQLLTENKVGLGSEAELASQKSTAITSTIETSSSSEPSSELSPL